MLRHPSALKADVFLDIQHFPNLFFCFKVRVATLTFDIFSAIENYEYITIVTMSEKQ